MGGLVALQIVALVVVAGAGTAVVLAREPLRAVIASGVLGLALAIMFMLFQAPDVALSMLVVAGVGLPVMLLLALAKIEADGDE
ncbi:MAG: hydrogenase subunit MbhD domain-containing protein [Solirubrobacteraceae bacterium]